MLGCCRGWSRSRSRALRTSVTRSEQGTGRAQSGDWCHGAFGLQPARRTRWCCGLAWRTSARSTSGGTLSDAEYRAARYEVERQLILPPDLSKIVDLDARREVLVSMAENIKRAAPSQRRALVELPVESINVGSRTIRQIKWAAPAAPFFETPADGLQAR